jgi:hypothetical protein
MFMTNAWKGSFGGAMTTYFCLRYVQKDRQFNFLRCEMETTKMVGWTGSERELAKSHALSGKENLEG